MNPGGNLVLALLVTASACVGILLLAAWARRADAKRNARHGRWPTPSELQDAGYKFRGR